MSAEAAVAPQRGGSSSILSIQCETALLAIRLDRLLSSIVARCLHGKGAHCQDDQLNRPCSIELIEQRVHAVAMPAW
jgi:hypothetical protein